MEQDFPAAASGGLPDVRYTLPFSAMVGQERMKLALCLNAVHPGVGGVLIRGERGTGKSTAVRALARLLPEHGIVVGCHFACDPDEQDHLCVDCRTRLAAGEDPLPRTRRRMRVVELPINASEDRVVGTIDLEAALKPRTWSSNASSTRATTLVHSPSRSWRSSTSRSS